MRSVVHMAAGQSVLISLLIKNQARFHIPLAVFRIKSAPRSLHPLLPNPDEINASGTARSVSR